MTETMEETLDSTGKRCEKKGEEARKKRRDCAGSGE